MTRLLRHRSVPIVALLAFMVLVAGQVLAQETSATDLMTRANERYERGEYAEAAQQYEALIDLGYSDTALYFNLGNAYLESGDLGRAILNYMRARELSPRAPDVTENLDLALGMTVDRIASERDSLVESLSYFGYRWATRGEVSVVALLLWVFAGMAIGALLVWRAFPLRRVLRMAAVVAAAATASSLVLLVSMIYANPYDRTGVVTAATVEVVSGPGGQYPEHFTLHSGAQVRVTGSRHGWIRIALPGGELEGWVPSHALESVGRSG